MKIYFFSFCLLCFSLFSCSNSVGVKLEPKAFNESIQESDSQVVDMRTPEEFAQGHIENAVNIDYQSDSFSESIRKLDNTKPVYVYCRSGNRSGNSTIDFKKSGFKSIYDLDGGILNWKAKGFQTVD